MTKRVQRATGTTYRKPRRAAATGAEAGTKTMLEPLYGAWVNEDRATADLSIVLIARHHSPGHLHFAAFFIEDGEGLVECLGNSGCPEPSFRRLLTAPHLLGTAASFVPCDLVLAQELVLGGAALARTTGVPLPREFGSLVWIVGDLPAEQELPPDLFPSGEDLLTFGIYPGGNGKPRPADHMAAAGDPVARLRQVARTSGAPFTPMFDRPGPEYGVDTMMNAVDGNGSLPAGMEPLVLTTVRFAHDDFDDAFIRLRGILDLQMEKHLPGLARFAWVRPYPAGHWNEAAADPEARQVLGHVVLTGRELVIEVKTRRWGEVVRGLLTAAGGTCLRYVTTAYRDPVPEIVAAVRSR